MEDRVIGTQVPPEMIRSYIKKSNKDKPQKDGIWYNKQTTTWIVKGKKQLIEVWRLEDEEGFCMFFNAEVYEDVDKCILLFKDKKEIDIDWNYGTDKKLLNLK